MKIWKNSKIMEKKWQEWTTRVLKPCTNVIKTFDTTMFVAKNKEEFNNVALMAFFNSIKTKYAASSLWVIYSCISNYMIDRYGCNLTRLVRLTWHLKMEISHYISNKSRMFSAEQIHEVIAHCMDAKVNNPKKHSLAFA